MLLRNAHKVIGARRIVMLLIQSTRGTSFAIVAAAEYSSQALSAKRGFQHHEVLPDLGPSRKSAQTRG